MIKNLLILDEINIAGGVETIQKNLIPEFCDLVDHTYWILPHSVANKYREYFKNLQNLKIIDLEFERHSLHDYAKKILKIFFRNSILYEYFKNLRIKKTIQQFHIDALFTTCIFTQLHPKTEIPTGGIFCDLNVEGELRRKVLSSLESWIKYSRFIFPISNASRGALIETYPSARYLSETIPLAASKPKFNAKEKRKDNLFTFYYPSNAMPNKNHLCLFEAILKLCRKRQDFQVILSGGNTDKFGNKGFFDDEQMSKTQKFYMQHKDILKNFIFGKGFVSEKEVAELYRSSSCVISSSSSEGFGFALSEGIAFGKPIIASDIKPFREQVVTYECASKVRFFKNQLSDSLKIQLDSMLSDPIAEMDDSEVQDILNRWTWKQAAKLYINHLST
tara:strand:+ start:9705 stop:10877 length:1173 start_codon:yes stop_codon:yes gene_type:complete